MIFRVQLYLHLEAHAQVQSIESIMGERSRKKFDYLLKVSMHHFLLKKVPLSKHLEQLLLNRPDFLEQQSLLPFDLLNGGHHLHLLSLHSQINNNQRYWITINNIRYQPSPVRAGKPWPRWAARADTQEICRDLRLFWCWGRGIDVLSALGWPCRIAWKSSRRSQRTGEIHFLGEDATRHFWSWDSDSWLT